MGLRLLLGIATIAYFHHLSATPGILEDVSSTIMKAHDEAKAYGINKISFNSTNINSRSITHKIIEDDFDDNSTAEAPIDPTPTDA